MREALAKCLSGLVNLDENDHSERPVDRLHALASAQIQRANASARSSKLSSLGVSLLSLKYANRPDEYTRAAHRLMELLRWSKPQRGVTFRLKIARQAVQEHIIDHCPRCGGSGEVPAHDNVDGAQRMKPCPPDEGGCGGHGKRRYTDRERAAAMELDRQDYHAASRLMAEALGFISLAEDEAIKTAKRLLERTFTSST